MAHRPRRWRAGRQKRRRLTDRPSTMPRSIHTAIDQTRAQSRGTFILGDSEPTLPAMGCVPATLLRGDAGAMLPFGEDRTQRRPWLVVNPGEVPAVPRASGLQPSGPTNFPGPACLPRATNFLFLPVLHCVAAAARCSPPDPRSSDHRQGRDGRDLAPPKGDSSWQTSAPSPHRTTASPARFVP